MAATDIQYGGLDPVIYTPDFTFLRYVLDKSTANYEKGLKSASSAFNNLKKELSDSANVQKRDTYLKDAQSQLQKIASSDLSLQQNVNYANSIFDPIATDKAIAFDAFHTNRIKTEAAKEDAWMNSENLEERKKYNPEIKQWLMRDLDSIKNGKGDFNNYKVEGRSAFAAVDAQDLLADEVKKQGFKVKSDSLGQPYIVTVEGGPGFTKNYTEFANNVLAANPVYQKQAQILGQNRAETIIEKYKTDPKYAPTWANKSNEEILKDYAANSYTEHRNSQKSYLDALNKNLVSESAEIEAALKGPNADKYIKGQADAAAGNTNTPEAQMWAALKGKADDVNNLTEKLGDLKKTYTNTYGENDSKFEENKSNYLNNFKDASTAANFFSNLQVSNDVTRFSNIKSSSSIKTIKEDRAYVDIMVAKTAAMSAINRIQDTQHDNALADAKFQELIRMDDAKLAALGKKKVKNADGTTSIVDGSAEITAIDRSATQITVAQTLNTLKDKVNNASSAALENVTSNYGSFYILKAAGQNDKEVGLLNNLFKRYFTSTDKKSIVVSKEEQSALNNASQYIQSFAKNNPDSDLANFTKNKNLKSIKIQDLPDLIEHAAAGLKTTDNNILQAKKAMDDYKKNSSIITIAAVSLDAGKRVVIDQLKNDPSFGALFVEKEGPDGKKYKDFINEDDILKRINSNVNLKRRYPELTDDLKRQIANQYITGAISAKVTPGRPSIGSSFTMGTTSDNGWTVINLNGKKYEINDGSLFPTDPKTYNKLVQRVNERTPLPQFLSATGGVIASPFYKLTGGTEQLVKDDLAKSTLTNSYILQDANTPIPVQEADQKAIRDAILEKDNVVNTSLYTSSPLNGGGQAVSITFKTEKGTKDTPPPVWSGKTYYFPIKPTETSPNIFHIFNNVNQISAFEPYKKSGDTYKINTFQADGVRAEVVPLAPGSTTGVVRMFYKPYNAETKSYSNTEIQYTDANGNKEIQYDLGKTTFPELEQNVYNTFIYPYVQGTMKYNAQVKANTTAAGGTPQTASSLYNMLVKKP